MINFQNPIFVDDVRKGRGRSKLWVNKAAVALDVDVDPTAREAGTVELAEAKDNTL